MAPRPVFPAATQSCHLQIHQGLRLKEIRSELPKKAQCTWNPARSGLCDITKIIPRLCLQGATQCPGTSLSPSATSVTWTSVPTPAIPSLRHPSPPTHDELLTPPSPGIFLPEHIVGPADIVTSHSITDTWCVLINCHLRRWPMGCGRRGEREGWETPQVLVWEQGGRQHGGPRLTPKEAPAPVPRGRRSEDTPSLFPRRDARSQRQTNAAMPRELPAGPFAPGPAPGPGGAMHHSQCRSVFTFLKYQWLWLASALQTVDMIPVPGGGGGSADGLRARD